MVKFVGTAIISTSIGAMSRLMPSEINRLKSTICNV